MRRASRVVGLGLLAAVALTLAAAAHAERVAAQGVGTAALPGTPGRSPRSEALDAALANAVEQVAFGLVGGASDPAAARAVRDALGAKPGRFAQGYRSLSEQERAGAEGAGAQIEVRIEAQVDRERVADALREAGLLAVQAAPPPPDAARRIVVEPVPSWTALEAVRRRLVELGAAQARLERVGAERAVLVIEGERSAASLVSALVASPPPGATVAASGQLAGSPRVRIDWLGAN